MSGRLPPLPSSADDPELAAFLATVAARRDRPLQLHAALGHAPAASRAFVALAYALRHDVALDRRLQEIAILTVAAEAGSPYERQQHEPLARAAGVSDTQIAALFARDATLDAFDVEAQTVIRFTRGMLADDLDDARFDQTRALLGDRGVVELVLTVAFYRATAMVLRALDVPLETRG